MSATTRQLSVVDLETIPDDGYRYELIEGALTVSPAPSRAHQTILQELSFRLHSWVRGGRIGRVFTAPVDVRFSAIDQVQPDLLVLLGDNLTNYRGNTVLGAPDLVVEIISPSSRRHDSVSKFALYAAHGVKEYWLADADQRWLRFYTLRDGVYEEILPVAGQLASIVLPGFTVDIELLFATLDEEF